jgi:hypothetical protein
MGTRKQIGVPMQKEALTEVHNASFSPDGRLAVTSDGGVVRLWDSHTGDPIGQPFALGEFPLFGQSPRFADSTHLLAPERYVIREKDLSWLLRDASPETVLFEAQLFTHRQVKPDGEPGIIPSAQWEAMRRKYQSSK